MDKLLTLMLCIAVIFMLIGLLPVHGEEAVYDNVIRLHVLANSDLPEDQALKLGVRDCVLAYASELLADADTQEQAAMRISQHQAEIVAVAEKYLRSVNRADTVRVEFSMESYPTRQYASCALPAGEYLSLRVLIGEGAGQNWWCVLFPSLCYTAAEGGSEVISASFTELGLSGEQYRIITDSEDATYRVRFKLLEVFEEIVG